MLKGSIRFYFKKTTDALPLDAESLNLIESEASQVKDIDLLFKETESYILERRAQFSNILSKYKKLLLTGHRLEQLSSYQFDRKHIFFLMTMFLRQNDFLLVQVVLYCLVAQLKWKNMMHVLSWLHFMLIQLLLITLYI